MSDDRSVTTITIDKVRAEAIRLAARTVSADADLHDPIHVGEACRGCRWREALLTFAASVEAGEAS